MNENNIILTNVGDGFPVYDAEIVAVQNLSLTLKKQRGQGHFLDLDLLFANSPTAGIAVLDCDLVFEVTTAGPSNRDDFLDDVKST